MVSDEGMTTYYNFQLPFDQHPADDRQAMLIRIAKFSALGSATQKQLAEAYGVSVKTVRRAVKIYREKGEPGFFEKPKPRRRTVFDEEMIRKASQLLAQGYSGSRAARELGIAVSTFNDNRRAGVISPRW